MFYAWNESIDLLIDIALKMKCQTKEFNQFYQQVVIPLCLKETREGSSCTDEHSKFWQEKKSVKCAESLLCCLIAEDGISRWWVPNNWKSCKSTKNIFTQA